jgi:hypothetical protein
MSLPLLIIFDIDETLIQFINTRSYHFWEEVDEETKKTFDYKENKTRKTVVLFRPYLHNFLQFVNKNSDRIQLGLWTYSEREYAEDIADIICKHYMLNKDPFIIKYGTEDIEDHDFPKSLNQFWNSDIGNTYNKLNTILVDDRLSNLCHSVNKGNSIVIEGFEPFGYTKQREPLNTENYTKAINDVMFVQLMDIINIVFSDFDGCSEEEIEDAFRVEKIFDKKRLKRTGLLKILQKIEHKDDTIEICSLGNIEHATNPAKGGRRHKIHKTHKKGSKKRHTKHKRHKTHKKGYIKI